METHSPLPQTLDGCLLLASLGITFTVFWVMATRPGKEEGSVSTVNSFETFSAVNGP